jgi:hypothetical protein
MEIFSFVASGLSAAIASSVGLLGLLLANFIPEDLPPAPPG